MITEKQKNPWSHQDEGAHYPTMKEWWTIEAIFRTKEDNRKWNLISSFSFFLFQFLQEVLAN